MNDLLRTTAGRKQTRAARLLGFGPAEPAPPDPSPDPASTDPPITDPLRPDPDPPTQAPPTPAPAPPRPAGKVPAGPRGDWWQPPRDFIGQLLRTSRRYS
jgi:hypothetical protein